MLLNEFLVRVGKEETAFGMVRILWSQTQLSELTADWQSNLDAAVTNEYMKPGRKPNTWILTGKGADRICELRVRLDEHLQHAKRLRKEADVIEAKARNFEFDW